MPDLVETLHVGLLRLILLESEFILDLVIGLVHLLFDAFLEVVHALGHPLLEGLQVLLDSSHLGHQSIGLSIKILQFIFQHGVEMGVREAGFEQVYTPGQVLITLHFFNEGFQAGELARQILRGGIEGVLLGGQVMECVL